MVIANTENITSLQRFAEWLIAWNPPALIEETIGCSRLLGMGMDEYQLIAFTHNLCMIGRDNILVDNNVI